MAVSQPIPKTTTYNFVPALRSKLPLGPIFFMPPGMTERVDSALSEKQMRLNKFRFSWWRRSVTRMYRAAHVYARCFGRLIFRRR